MHTKGEITQPSLRGSTTLSKIFSMRSEGKEGRREGGRKVPAASEQKKSNKIKIGFFFPFPQGHINLMGNAQAIIS